jgi:plastocyanin
MTGIENILMKNHQYRFSTSLTIATVVAIFLTGASIAHLIIQYQLNIYAQTDNATGMTTNQTISNQSSTTTTTTGSQESSSISVSIVPNAATMGDKAYSPNPIEVKVGGGVTWSNDDSQIHTATSGSVGSADSGSVFDSGILSPGATFDFVFDKAGTYDYYCTLHPQMVGTVNVT